MRLASGRLLASLNARIFSRFSSDSSCSLKDGNLVLLKSVCGGSAGVSSFTKSFSRGFALNGLRKLESTPRKCCLLNSSACEVQARASGEPERSESDPLPDLWMHLLLQNQSPAVWCLQLGRTSCSNCCGSYLYLVSNLEYSLCRSQ